MNQRHRQSTGREPLYASGVSASVSAHWFSGVFSAVPLKIPRFSRDFLSSSLVFGVLVWASFGPLPCVIPIEAVHRVGNWR